MMAGIAAHISGAIALSFAGLLNTIQPIGPSISAIMRSVGEIMRLSPCREGAENRGRPPIAQCAPCSMRMPVVQIGVMRVAMDQPRMRVDMRMRLARRIALRMRVMMMQIMYMAMLVLERLMRMRMLVPLGEVEIEPDRHQGAGSNQRHRQRLAEHRQRDHGADKGRDRVIG